MFELLLVELFQVFHCFIYSRGHIDLQGSSIMPLFFILSGFSLMLAYGGGAEGGSAPSPPPPWVAAGYGAFLRNRLARTYPAYLAATVFAVPLWLLAYYGASKPHALT